MRWMFLERDNVTHPSEADKDGNSYVASFEFFPFHEGTTFSVYKGILSGDAGRRGQFCVIKTLVEKPAQTGDLDHVIKRAKEAQRLAVSFNRHLGYRAMWFAIPFLSRLKHVSDFNGVFRCISPHDKRLVRDEFVVIETLIEGVFQTFNSKNGTAPRRQLSTLPSSSKKIPSNDNSTINTAKSSKQKSQIKKKKNTKRNSLDKCYNRSDSYNAYCKPGSELTINESLGPNNLAQAFGHYVWHVTKTSVICGMEGVFSDSTYFFTTPVVHSIDSSFGLTDGGPEAVVEFFSCHRCNNICHQWPVYSPLNVNNSKKQINFSHSSSNFSHPSSSSHSSNPSHLSHPQLYCSSSTSSYANCSNNDNSNAEPVHDKNVFIEKLENS